METADIPLDSPAGSDERCIHELCLAYANAHPGGLALVYRDQSITYGELDRRAEDLACRLRHEGVGPERIVGLCVERSLELVVGLLGIFKAGGVCLPLDPTHPRERLLYMLGDARVERVVAGAAFDELFPQSAFKRIRVTAPAGPAESRRAEPKVHPDNLAYVIYTSGSTGSPKGVAMTHRALRNLVDWHVRAYRSCGTQRVLQLTAISFDISLQEIFTALTGGKTLIMPDAEVRIDPKRLRHTIVEHQVDEVFAPQVLLEQLAEEVQASDDLVPVKQFFQAGEPLRLTPAMVRMMERCAARLHNHYGPTEAHVVSSFALPSDLAQLHGPVPIGRPISNMRFYVLDPDLQPVAPGETGELCISGIGLARGYLGRPAVTAERFVPNPFEPAARMYRTGDLVRYLPDGNLQILGRSDHQIKLRGFRIELGEVESAIRQLDAVREALVVPREDGGGDQYLAAYVIASAPGLDIPALREGLRRRLPHYMVPASITLLDALPVDANGKIDRKALPLPARASSQTFVAPRTAAEEIVAAIWREVLDLDAVGVNDDFYELGGHSIKALHICTRVRSEFHLDIPVRALFDAPTVSQFCRYVGERRRGGAERRLPALACDPLRSSGPLSIAQECLWFLEQMGLPGQLYSLPVALRLKGPLDPAILQDAVGRLVRRHDSLRTRIRGTADGPMQYVTDGTDIHLTVHDFTAHPAQQALPAAERCIDEQVQRGFQLDSQPLFTADLFRLAAQDHVLLLRAHHIIADGWSLEVLLRELGSLYAAIAAADAVQLPALPASYIDYAVWQRNRLQGAELDELIAYWKARLQGAPGTLDLPFDKPRPAVPSFKGRRVPFEVAAAVKSQIGELARVSRATPYMVLLAAFKTCLALWTGQRDLIVGSPAAGRPLQETEHSVGLFTNTLALRTRLSGNPAFGEIVAAVRDACLGAFAHEDLPFQRLVQELRVPRDRSRNPLFQAAFGFNTAMESLLVLPQIQVDGQPLNNECSMFDLSLEIIDERRRLRGVFEYAAELFESRTIDELCGYFQALLQRVCSDPQLRLDEMPVLGRVSSQRRTPAQAHGRTAEADAVFWAQHAGTCEKVAACWREALSVDSLGIDDNFFDLGGDSLLAMRLLLKLSVSLQVELPMHLLFEAPSIREMSRHIDAALEARFDSPGGARAAQDLPMETGTI